MSNGLEKAAHIAEVIAIPIALIAVVVTGIQTQQSLELSKSALEQTREANITYQGTPICEAYREQVIDLHLLGYTRDDIRQTFLGEHDDVTKPASEENNVYDKFYVPGCGDIEGITRMLSTPPPNERSRR